MLTPRSIIQISDYQLNSLINIEIRSALNTLIDTATLTIPRRVTFDPINNGYSLPVSDVFRSGNPINIQLGYDTNLTERFTGIVKRIDARAPTVIECEDIMYLLKQTVVKRYTNKSTKLTDLFAEILPVNPLTGDQFSFEVEDITFGQVLFEKVSVLQIFDYLKKTFGLTINSVDNVIYGGFAYKTNQIEKISTANPIRFHFQKNVLNNSLTSVKEEDTKYRVVVINFNTDTNKKNEITTGDLDGEQRTIHTINADSKAMQLAGDEYLQKLKYTGLRGSLTTFLDPRVRHGDVIELVDDLFEENNGVYLVSEVVTSSGVGGGRQTLTIDLRL